MNLNVEELRNDNDTRDWDDYVQNSAYSTFCHLSAWREIIEKTYRYKAYYPLARENNEVVRCILPFVFIKSRFFGNYLVSLPFLDYGGICADDFKTSALLLQASLDLKDQSRTHYLELRHLGQANLDLPAVIDKVTMLMDLERDSQDLWKSLGLKFEIESTSPESFLSELNMEDWNLSTISMPLSLQI